MPKLSHIQAKKANSTRIDIVSDPQTLTAIKENDPEYAVLVDAPPDQDTLEPGVFHTANGDIVNAPNKFLVSKHRTHAFREADLVEIVPLYLKGYTQYEIAQHLNSIRDYRVSRTMVYNDIMEIYKRWQIAYLKGTNELKVRELARVDRLEAEYWDAWERSKQAFISVKQDRILDETGTKRRTVKDADGNVISEQEFESSMRPTHARTKTMTKKEERDGNPAYLQGVQWCIEKRCQILGLDAAKNVNINWRNQAKAAGLDPEDVINGLEERFLASMAGSGLSGSLGESSEEN